MNRLYDFEHVVNDIELTVINDGNGSQCGYDYRDRCNAARFPEKYGPFAFKTMARNYDEQRVAAGARAATEAELSEAGERLRKYYAEHIRE